MAWLCSLFLSTIFSMSFSAPIALSIDAATAVGPAHCHSDTSFWMPSISAIPARMPGGPNLRPLPFSLTWFP
jgi:hypothetical protein